MGLDVYVGPLCRYYVGDWETIVQRMARESGIPIEIVREGEEAESETEAPPEEPIQDASEAREVILLWKQKLSHALGQNLQAPLEWEENPEGEYYTDKPTWECYFDLLLWAAYHEHPEMNRPTESLDDLTDDPAYLASASEDFQTRFPHLLRENELWLPVDFPFVFQATDVTGSNVGMGSSFALLKELEALNAETWGLSDEEIASARETGSDRGEPLEHGARFALCVLMHLARESVKHRLPMKLDY